MYSPTDEVVVVDLCSPYEKKFVLKTIAKYRRDTKSAFFLKHAGFDNDSPIYINEDLTPRNHKILRAALKLKTERKIKTAYSHGSDEPILIELFDELHQLFYESNN